MGVRQSIGVFALAALGLSACGPTSFGVELAAREPVRETASTGNLNPPPAPLKPCAELMPSTLGTPVTVRTERLPASLGGRAGTSDEEGTVLLILDGKFGSQVLDFYAFGAKSPIRVTSSHFEPIGLSAGFAGARNITVSRPPQSGVVHFSKEGNETASPFQPGLLIQSRNPTGGLVALALETGELEAFDDRAQLRWKRALPVAGSVLRALGVDRDGNTLVLYDATAESEAGTVLGIWVDAQGNAGAPFSALTRVAAGEELQLFASAEEGLFLRHIGPGDYKLRRWSARLRRADATAQPVPEFLAARPQSTLQLVRGGTAYALVATHRPSAPYTEGRCDVEVLDLAGNSCGTLDFSLQGRGCTSVSIGPDGTVITQPPLSESDCNFDTDGACSWTWHWWPGLLK